MAYRLRAGTSVEKSIHKVAREQIDKAIEEVKSPALDDHETVHQVRKRCKKIRGLIRLVRPQFETTYDFENAWYRDSARRLSYVRDAQSIIETFDELMDHFEEQLERGAFDPVRRQLTERRQNVAKDEVGLRKRLEEFLERMKEGRRRVAGWRLQEDGFDAVEGGLRKTYKRGRSAMAEAYRNPSTENFHQWRKRAKYHWYHMRLLRRIWNEPMNGRRQEAHVLADYLGDDHDLSILRETVLETPDEFGSDDTVQALVGLTTQRQIELRTKARTLGERVYAEKPKRFTARLGDYWRAWQEEGHELPGPTGGADLPTP